MHAISYNCATQFRTIALRATQFRTIALDTMLCARGTGPPYKTLQDQVTKINFACVVNLKGLLLLVLPRDRMVRAGSKDVNWMGSQVLFLRKQVVK